MTYRKASNACLCLSMAAWVMLRMAHREIFTGSMAALAPGAIASVMLKKKLALFNAVSAKLIAAANLFSDFPSV